MHSRLNSVSYKHSYMYSRLNSVSYKHSYLHSGLNSMFYKHSYTHSRLNSVSYKHGLVFGYVMKGHTCWEAARPWGGQKGCSRAGRDQRTALRQQTRTNTHTHTHTYTHTVRGREVVWSYCVLLWWIDGDIVERWYYGMCCHRECCYGDCCHAACCYGKVLSIWDELPRVRLVSTDSASPENILEEPEIKRVD